MTYFRCRHCESVIPGNTEGVFTRCHCGKIAIDGKLGYTRLIGDFSSVEKLQSKPSTITVFRIKQLSTGLYFGGYEWGRFTKNGKLYFRRPTMRWITEHDGECVVVEYKLENF